MKQLSRHSIRTGGKEKDAREAECPAHDVGIRNDQPIKGDLGEDCTGDNEGDHKMERQRREVRKKRSKLKLKAQWIRVGGENRSKLNSAGNKL